MRRRFISNWPFQSAFSFALIRGVLIASLIPGLTAILTLYLMGQHSELVEIQKRVFENGLRHLGIVLFEIVLILSIFFGVVGIILSQRFVGPLTRIESWSVQYLMKQNPGPLQLRKNDELSSVAIILDRIIRKYDSEGRK